MRKKKLTVEEQVEYIRDKSGIKFNIIREEEAKSFLSNNTYYFKIKSYAKNYEKYIEGENAGKYINLEFAYLVEISKIDMYFRRIILKMTLDIEHFLKVQLLRDFQDNDTEDGYSIIDEFLREYDYIEKNIDLKGKNSVCTDLVVKYKGDFAIWNIVEILSFNDFTKLYQMYYGKYKNKDSMGRFLWSVRLLRNAAAHNSCLLNSLRTPYNYDVIPNKMVINYLSKVKGISRTARGNRMRNPVMHDFIVTLYVFNNIASSKEIKVSTMTELKDLVDNRISRNKEFFKKNQILTAHYDFAKKVIDYFYDLCV
ncbi:Abi family protein [Clostridium tetani]|uniref:Abi family protein n=1 Tax=Clostridium tetani TaxID=1513 RepID=UPI00100AA588|nr:Abi family protein [Clostridium tetani]RXM74055.1 Abi family protein [Clostridium tetani]RYU97957.1 Abi family protein [Clostridium tetani]